jgi:phosphate-selective porin OprO/OprP
VTCFPPSVSRGRRCLGAALPCALLWAVVGVSQAADLAPRLPALAAPAAAVPVAPVALQQEAGAEALPSPESAGAPSRAAGEEESPLLAPDQPGNIRAGAGELFGEGPGARDGPVLDPNQVGNLRRRLDELEGRFTEYPIIRLSGFFQLDDGLYAQSAASRVRYGDMLDGVGFRRTRLQAIGELTEFFDYTIEMDFALPGRPSFVDVWGEIDEIPWFGTIRIGQFRQPGLMDSWTSVRHLEFLERSASFQAVDPFRRVGIMAYAMADDERTAWAYSVYTTGLTFWDGDATVSNSFGDDRFGTQITDNGGVGFASRITHLVHYDELSEGRYLLHVGTGFVFGQFGGEGDELPSAKTYNPRIFPEFFVGDLAGGGLTAAGTPDVLSGGRIRAENFTLSHIELAGNHGAFHFQTEGMLETVNQRGGPTMLVPTAYFQCGAFLTGETVLYLKEPGVFDYNVVPHTPFFGTGRHGRIRGWGAWEVAFRWSYVDLSLANVNPANQLLDAAGPPPNPNYGVLNESTVAVNWWWNRYTRVEFNWIHSMPDLRGFGRAPFDIFATRFQVEF